MLIAMGIASVISIGIGVYPEALYSILPNTVDYVYVPYTADHVISQLLLLFGAFTAFSFLMYTGIYPPEKRSINIDADWVYRKAAPALVSLIGSPIGRIYAWFARAVFETLPRFLAWVTRNPLAAMKIGTDTLLLPLSGGSKEAKKSLEREKVAYPGTVAQWSVSTALGIALVIFLAYLILLFI